MKFFEKLQSFFLPRKMIECDLQYIISSIKYNDMSKVKDYIKTSDLTGSFNLFCAFQNIDFTSYIAKSDPDYDNKYYLAHSFFVDKREVYNEKFTEQDNYLSKNLFYPRFLLFVAAMNI